MRKRSAVGTRPDALQVEIAWRVRAASSAAGLLRRVARHVARGEGFQAGILSVAVVGRRAMATLHERHSGVAGATDVLTFDLGTDKKRHWIEGEIVVCRDVAVREARARSAAPIRELALYVAHGVLHLAGHDDHVPAGYIRMHRAENRYLSQVSLGSVFGTIID